METVVLQVRGMACPGCAQRIDRVLHYVEGVRGVIVDYVCGRVEVRVGPELGDWSVLTERIEAAGYEVTEGMNR